MVLGALGCINNADFEKNKGEYCARCTYYLSEITTRNVLVLIDLQSNPPKRPQSAANDMKGVESIHSARPLT